MKKLIYITGAALVMLASASCEKKETVKEAQPSVEKTAMVFTATSGNGELKTTIKSDGTTAVWSATDNLKVFTAEDTQGSVCNYKSGAGTATAEFEGQCAKTGPWTAICPASSAKSFSNGTITFTMPETQTYAENTFAAGAMPCVAYSETNTFNFNHSFGVLKLSLKLMEGKTGSVKSITVTDNGGAKLNGTFTVNPQNSAVATYSTGGTSSVILNCTNVALNTSTATDFWIVVPEGAFGGGFDVTVTSTDDIETKISTTKANTITAGKVKEMPVQLVEFKEPLPKDACGNEYNIVEIGEQIWLKENMRCNKYDTGSEAYEAGIENITLLVGYNSSTDPRYLDNPNTPKPSYMDDTQWIKLGYYYNFAAAMGYRDEEEAKAQTGLYDGTRQGICPNGFHIPSAAEWDALVTYIEVTDGKGKGTAGKHLRTISGWQVYIYEGSEGEDTYGFACLPANSSVFGKVYNIGSQSFHYTSDAYSDDNVVTRSMAYDFNDVYDYGEDYFDKSQLMSVRCIKD